MGVWPHQGRKLCLKTPDQEGHRTPMAKDGTKVEEEKVTRVEEDVLTKAADPTTATI